LFAKTSKNVAAELGNLAGGGIAPERNHSFSNGDAGVAENSALVLLLSLGLNNKGTRGGRGGVAGGTGAEIYEAAGLLGTLLKGTSSSTELIQHSLADTREEVSAQVGDLACSGVAAEVDDLLADGDTGAAEDASLSNLLAARLGESKLLSSNSTGLDVGPAHNCTTLGKDGGSGDSGGDFVVRQGEQMAGVSLVSLEVEELYSNRIKTVVDGIKSSLTVEHNLLGILFDIVGPGNLGDRLVLVGDGKVSSEGLEGGNSESLCEEKGEQYEQLGPHF